MKNLISLMAILSVLNLTAQEKSIQTSFEVNGVCGMCKARIEKAAIQLTGVKLAKWSIETHKLKVIYNSRKTDPDQIAKQVAAAGHDTKAFKAPEEAYNSLVPCCKYRDEDVLKNHQ